MQTKNIKEYIKETVRQVINERIYDETEMVDENPNFVVYLWTGSGYGLSTFAVNAINEDDAIDRAVEYIAQEYIDSELLVSQEDYDSLAAEEGEECADEYYRYCSGGDYVRWENLRVEEISPEELDRMMPAINRRRFDENKKQKKVKKSLVENIKNIKDNYKLLKEYMEYQDGVEEDINGDQMLDTEIKNMDDGLPETKTFIVNIMKNALSAMQQLSDHADSPEFETLNAIFTQCQKYNTNMKKNAEETVV